MKVETIAIENDIRNSFWKSKNLKNKSKDRVDNFLVMFSSRKTDRAIERWDDSLILATIRNDTRNTLNIQHNIPCDIGVVIK